MIRKAILASTILAIPLGTVARAEDRVRFIVDKEGFDDSAADIEAVCRSAGRQIWRHGEGVDGIVIQVAKGKSGPITFFDRGKAGEFRVRLDTGGQAWSQYAYQFAHEACHVLCGGNDDWPGNLWFEETLCETASLYSLRRMSVEWRTKAPYGNWKGYAPSLGDYADNVIRGRDEYLDIVRDGLPAYYREHADDLRENPDRPRHERGDGGRSARSVREGTRPLGGDSVAQSNPVPEGRDVRGVPDQVAGRRTRATRAVRREDRRAVRRPAGTAGHGSRVGETGRAPVRSCGSASVVRLSPPRTSGESEPTCLTPPVQNFIDGEFADHRGDRLDDFSPLDGSLLTSVPLSTANEVDNAVAAARAAFLEWSSRTLKERAKVAYRYRELLLRHTDELAELIHVDHGKTVGEGRAEIVRAIEVTEFACSLPQLAAGEVLEVSRGVECRVDRVPLGVVASVVPFNFPMMVPHWTIPIAITLGNTFVFKPSEQVPLTATRMAELLAEAGLPAGVFNVIHGSRPVVERICDHPDVRAVTFVGSTAVAKSVYTRATGNLKRALALGGAKNHLFVLPDADPAATATNVVASMAGCAGQRCMAAASMLALRGSEPIIDEVCEAARRMIPGENLGPVISAAAKERIETVRHRGRTRGGEGSGRRTEYGRSRSRGGLLRRCDRARRGPARLADRNRGGVRPGARRHSSERRGRGGRDRECLAVRQRRRRLHAGRRAGAIDRRTGECRYDRREHRRPGPGPAVRLRWLERLEVRRRRHHRQELDRVLDPIAEDDDTLAMNPTSGATMHRLLEDEPFPPYTFVPDRAPHPIRDPDGHSFGLEERDGVAPDVDDPRGSRDFLRAVDLFHAGYYWEAHEVWEGLWIAAGRTSPLAMFLKALIKLAAAGVKVREGRRRGIVLHAERAAELFDEAREHFGDRMVLGLDPSRLAAAARDIANDPPTCEHDDTEPRIVFDLVLLDG